MRRGWPRKTPLTKAGGCFFYSHWLQEGGPESKKSARKSRGQSIKFGGREEKKRVEISLPARGKGYPEGEFLNS